MDLEVFVPTKNFMKYFGPLSDFTALSQSEQISKYKQFKGMLSNPERSLLEKQLPYLTNNLSDSYSLNQMGLKQSNIPIPETHIFNEGTIMPSMQEINNIEGNPISKDNVYSKTIDNNSFGDKSYQNDYLKAATSAQEANRALGITNGVFQGLGALTNAGLGIWGAIESNKNLKKQREVADKQIALAEEQIQASRQYRNERANEIARLNRVRSNTTKAFNTGSVITRSY